MFINKNFQASNAPINGSISSESANRLIEMQEALERMKTELANSLKQSTEITTRYYRNNFSKIDGEYINTYKFLWSNFSVFFQKNV